MSTFTMKLAIVLAGVSAAIAASTAPTVVDSSTMLVVMGQGALDEQDFSVFAECVKPLNSSYRAYADEGVLVIIPPTNRTIDIKTTDEELWKCIESSASTISLAIESSEFYDQVHENSTYVATMRHTDAVKMGVKGQVVVDRVPSSAKTDALQKRDVAYYYAYYSDENTCRGDYGYFYTNTCYGAASAYSSVAAGNLDPIKCLNIPSGRTIRAKRETTEPSLLLRLGSALARSEPRIHSTHTIVSFLRTYLEVVAHCERDR